MQNIFELLPDLNPKLVVIDLIQTLQDADLAAA